MGVMPAAISFDQLYRQHFPFVHRSLRRLGAPPGDALDLAQEGRFSDFEGRSRIETWLFGICLRVASDHRRRAVVRREVPVGEAELRAAPDPSVASQIEQRDRVMSARRILDGLPEPQKLVLMLFELEGWSGEDIAEALALPVGTVRSRLRLARTW
jgi:RNA polymerase sigma-70 factor (ECF subfamily)